MRRFGQPFAGGVVLSVGFVCGCYTSYAEFTTDDLDAREAAIDCEFGGNDDATTADEAQQPADSELAPRCEQVPENGLRAEGTARFEINRGRAGAGGTPSPQDYLLHGLGARGAGSPTALFMLPVETEDPGGGADLPRLLAFDHNGVSVDPPLEFDGIEPQRQPGGWFEHGDLVGLPDDSAVAVWRLPVSNATEPSAFRTYVHVFAGGELHRATVIHEAESTGDQVFPDATAVAVGDRVWLLSAGLDGVLMTPLDDLDLVMVVPTERPPTGELRALALDAERIVVAWSERTTPAWAGVTANAAIVGTDIVATAQAVVFAAVPDMIADVHLAVAGSAVYLARYDREDSSLRDSRIRIARLDEGLRRVEPDRWIDGWGGLQPEGMSLLTWDARVWVVFQTLDWRYGTNPALYAQPVTEEACGYSVDDPVAVFAPHFVCDRCLLATAGSDEIWAVIAFVRDTATADLLRIAPRE